MCDALARGRLERLAHFNKSEGSATGSAPESRVAYEEETLGGYLSYETLEKIMGQDID
jgi:hypothetical protein